MSISVIPLNRAAVALEVGGEMTDISGGVRAARLAVASRSAAYFTLESGWARQFDGGRQAALVLIVIADSDLTSACTALRDWLAAGGARSLAVTQSDLTYSGTFRLRGLTPLVDAQAGDGKPALVQARLVLDGVLAVE